MFNGFHAMVSKKVLQESYVTVMNVTVTLVTFCHWGEIENCVKKIIWKNDTRTTFSGIEKKISNIVGFL